MLTFKEQKAYAIKMWKEIKSLLRKRTGNSYYTCPVSIIKREIMTRFNWDISKGNTPKRKKYITYVQHILWKYDCILCQYASVKYNACNACPLVRMGFPACQDKCSSYATVDNAFTNSNRTEVDIRKAERACDIIIRAIRKLTKRINYDKI